MQFLLYCLAKSQVPGLDINIFCCDVQAHESITYFVAVLQCEEKEELWRSSGLKQYCRNESLMAFSKGAPVIHCRKCMTVPLPGLRCLVLRKDNAGIPMLGNQSIFNTKHIKGCSRVFHPGFIRVIQLPSHGNDNHVSFGKNRHHPVERIF